MKKIFKHLLIFAISLIAILWYHKKLLLQKYYKFNNVVIVDNLHRSLIFCLNYFINLLFI